MESSSVRIAQCLIYDNTALGGAAIRALFFPPIYSRLHILDSTIVKNSNDFRIHGHGIWLDNFSPEFGPFVSIENSILWKNVPDVSESGGGTFQEQVVVPNPSQLDVKSSCIAGIANTSYVIHGSMDVDPLFQNEATGDLRLTRESPCIDTGNNYLDYDPVTVGWQPLPQTDLAGQRRIVDGNSDGSEVIDMGAFEYQGE